MIRQTLHDGWTCSAASNDAVPAQVLGRRIAARVPGCIHTDLLRAGLIEDPYLDRNEWKVQWIGHNDWLYACRFDLDPRLADQERIDLVFDGLDTVARIELNGVLVGETFNMHHPHRFDIRRHLRPSGNELRITFRSAVKYATEMYEKIGPRPWTNGDGGPFNFIRKMACNFGWDWGPILVTCGMWRPVRLEGWSRFRIASVIPRSLESQDHDVDVELSVQLEYASEDELGKARLSAWVMEDTSDPETNYAAVDPDGTSVVIRVPVREPRRWWPRGHGDQPLYNVELDLADRDPIDVTRDRWSGRIGLRTVELDTSPDEIGRKFVLKVNGKPIFCKGANWIPDDCFLDRACTPERYRRRIQQAVDANMNMLRVWGGGIYETDEFYGICDEMGVMVWQDFLFACSTYPEEEPIRSQVLAEARYNVARLSRHPALVIWNGCNENVWGYRDWGWKEDPRVVGRTWGAGYYYDLLARVVAEVDPSRPYWPASPSSGDPDYENGLHPNLPTHGNTHAWDVGREHYSAYRKSVPRFCSEFGFQAPPTHATLARAIAAEQRRFGSPAMTSHQKSPGWGRNIEKHLEEDFGDIRDFDDRCYLLQVNQVRAIRLGVEWFRAHMPECMGALYWQLNDCWPVLSWSAIDGDGRKKPLWFATRRFFAPRLLSIQPEGGHPHRPGEHLILHAVNDTDERWTAPVFTQHVSFTTGRKASHRFSSELDVLPRSVQQIRLYDEPIANPREPGSECLICEADEQRALWFFDVDRNLTYPTPAFEADLKRESGRHELTITAGTLLRDLCIFQDRLDADATISDQCVTLLPGERFTFVIESGRKLSREQLTAPPVFQCVNGVLRR